MAHRHVVSSGECLSVIAARYGYASYRTLYEHPDNAPLKRRRPNPNVLHPGDVVMIPERQAKEVNAASGRVHRFQLKCARKVLRLLLLDHDVPLVNEPYQLTVGGDGVREGRTDGSGRLEENVPLGRAIATLVIARRTLRLRLGHLNPIKEATDSGVSGAQARLVNLGYRPGPVDGKLGVRTRGALALFQADEDLTVNGELDDDTRGALVRRHGC